MRKDIKSGKCQFVHADYYFKKKFIEHISKKKHTKWQHGMTETSLAKGNTDSNTGRMLS